MNVLMPTSYPFVGGTVGMGTRIGADVVIALVLM